MVARRAHEPLHRVDGLRQRAFPEALRLEYHLATRKHIGPGARVQLGVAKRAAVPQRAAGPVANLKGGQRAAVKQVDADPVPAHGVGMQELSAPFVIEPGRATAIGRDRWSAGGSGSGMRCAGAASHWQALIGDADLAVECHLRLAVVPARLCWPGSFARHAARALQQHGLGGPERQLQAEVARRHLRQVGAVQALERPVVQAQIGVTLAGLRDREPLTRYALVVPEAAAPKVGQRGVGKQQMARSKARSHCLRGLQPYPEESQLKAQIVPLFARARRAVTGDVPPFGAQLRMAAEIAREGKRCRRRRASRRGQPQGRTQAREHQPAQSAGTHW